MKIKYINDVPENIKAITFLGDTMNTRINQLQTRIKNYQSEIYRLEDKKNFQGLNVQEESQLDFYKKDLPKITEELKQLTELQPKEETKSNIMYLIIPAIIIFALIKRKK